MNIYAIIAINLLGGIMTIIFLEIAVKLSEYNDRKRKERIRNGIPRKNFFRLIKNIFRNN